MTPYWKGKAVERLREYEVLRRAAENLPDERTSPRLQGRQGSDVWLDTLTARDDMTRRLSQARSRLRRTQHALGVLNPQERLVLQMIDIHPARGNPDKLCELMECELATVYRRREAALRKFAAALYGKELA